MNTFEILTLVAMVAFFAAGGLASLFVRWDNDTSNPVEASQEAR